MDAHRWHGVGRTKVRFHWEDSARVVRAGRLVPAHISQCQECGLLVAHHAQWDGERWECATGHGIDLDSLALGRPPRACKLLQMPGEVAA